MSGTFQKLLAQSKESLTSACNLSGLIECKKRNTLPLLCSSISLRFVGNGYLSKNSNKVIALNFWDIKLYSVLEDISSHESVIQLNTPCFRSWIWYRCFLVLPWFWAERCSSFSISSRLFDGKSENRDEICVENEFNVPPLSIIFSKMSSVETSSVL